MVYIPTDISPCQCQHSPCYATGWAWYVQHPFNRACYSITAMHYQYHAKNRQRADIPYKDLSVLQLQKGHNLIEILFLCFSGNGKPVNNSQNTAAATGQQF